MDSTPPTVEEIWSVLINRVAGTKDEVNGLTERKLMERGRLLEDESTPEKLVFEVERHNAIAGATYRKGLPMSSFETRRVKYEYIPCSGSIAEIESRVIAREIDPLSEVREWEIDYTVWVAIDETNGDYEITDSDNGLRFMARTLDEAEKLMREKVTSWNWGEQLKIEVDEGPELEDMLVQMRTEACRIAVNKLRDAWAKCEAEADED